VRRAGDVLIGPLHLAGLALPAAKLPDVTPLKPLAIQLRGPTGATIGGAPGAATLSTDPPTNPTMDEHTGGYEIDLCNASPTQAHTLMSVSARIDGFVAYTGQLSQWNPCSGAYSRAGSVGGCGGAYFAAEYLRAVFDATAGPGSVIQAGQVASGRDDGAGQPYAGVSPLPLRLAPHQSYPIDVGMTVPTAPGGYSFAFGLALDGAAPVSVSAPQPVLFAPVAHTWTAQACQQPAMQAQIPATTDPPAYYICPQ
jgi:hypothetical protein